MQPPKFDLVAKELDQRIQAARYRHEIFGDLQLVRELEQSGF